MKQQIFSDIEYSNRRKRTKREAMVMMLGSKGILKQNLENRIFRSKWRHSDPYFTILKNGMTLSKNLNLHLRLAADFMEI